jgi:hypothetical protein
LESSSERFTEVLGDEVDSKSSVAHPAALTCSMITDVRAQNSKRIIPSGVPTVKKLISIFMTAVLLTIGLCASVTRTQSPRWQE